MFEQVRGERMPQCVRADGFADSAGFAGIPDNVKYHDPCQLSAPTVEKQNIRTLFLYGQHIAVEHIQSDFVDGCRRNGD